MSQIYDWPSITIAFPTYKRADLLPKTLDSIKTSIYPGQMELLIVQSGPDVEMGGLAEIYGARYVELPRADFPAFQSITEMWNTCIASARNDIVILQCAEVFYRHREALANMVTCVIEGGKKTLATPLVEDLDENGNFANWQNHPTAGSRPGWVSGSGPHAFWRKSMVEHGGYDTRFYGYGHEDDYFFYTLRKNGWDIKYVTDAVCAHQWHPRTEFEPITGYANRSLIRVLYTETEAGVRLPLPNRQPLLSLKVAEKIATEDMIDIVVVTAREKFKMGDTFENWWKTWREGDRRPDELFVAQRIIANEGNGVVSEVGEMITEAAWAIIRSKEARQAADAAPNESWQKRCDDAAELHLVWATTALMRADRLMEGAT